LKFNVDKNDTIRFKAYVLKGQSGFNVNFGDGTSKNYSTSGIVTHRYAIAYSPAVVTIDDGLLSIGVND